MPLSIMCQPRANENFSPYDYRYDRQKYKRDHASSKITRCVIRVLLMIAIT